MPTQTLAALRQVFRFPVFGRLWKFLVALAAYSAAVVFVDKQLQDVGTPAAPRVAEVVLTSLIFGWLLQFRTNTAYDRWYEGRKLWGQLVNVSRNMALKAAHLVKPAEPDAAAEAGPLLVRFAGELRAMLGHGRQPGEPHGPMATAGELYALVRRWDDAGRLTPWAALAFDAELRALMDVSGACERIRSTPLAASYRGLLRKGIGIYLLAVPWLVVDDIGYFTVLLTLLVGYVLIALELIADDIEDPFGYGPDDLPLDRVVGVIAETAGGYRG